MTESEMAGMFVLTITAGHETTANTLANAMHYLAANPDARRYLTEDPARIPRAVEELIRFCSPSQHLARTTTREVTVSGRTIPAGQPVALMWTAGNMDCDFARDARGNLTFGSGIHRCVGEFLARMEIRIVLEEFLRRIPDFELDGPGEAARWNSIGFYRLPARFTAKPAG
jgi:cytochrome P450